MRRHLDLLQKNLKGRGFAEAHVSVRWTGSGAKAVRR
jgi:hypothetical protein